MVRRAFLAVFLPCILFFLPGVRQTCAQEPFPAGLSQPDLILYYLSQADTATTTAAWLDAVSPMLPVVEGWEQERWRQTVEERLVSWAESRLSETLPLPDVASFLAALAAAEAEQDMPAWSAGADRALREVVGDWERRAQTICEELLAGTGGRQREALQASLRVTMAEHRRGVQREFERLYAQGRNAFVARRLREEPPPAAWREGGTPEEVANALIQDTGRGLDSLLAVPDSAPQGQTSTAALRLHLEGWEERVRDAFEQGMERWGRAEVELLNERLRWESTAEETYREGEAGWEQAFGLLAEARKRWMSELESALLGSGAALEARELAYAEDLERLGDTLALASLEELAGLDRELEGLLTVYRESREMLDLAERNIAALERSGQSGAATREALGYWREIRTRYEVGAARVLEQVDALARDVTSFRAGTPRDSLAREVVRLEERLRYWETQVQAAAGVVSYREAPQQEREPEAAVRARYEGALGELREADDALQELVAELRRLQGEVGRARGEVAGSRAGLQEASALLEQAEERCEAAWIPWAVEDDRVIRALLETAADPQQLAANIEICRSDRSLYYAQVVRPALDARAAARELCEGRERACLQAAAMLAEAVDLYNRAQAALASRQEEVRLARGRVQAARELLDFVVGGAEGWDPSSVYRQRLVEYGRVTTVLAVLKELQAESEGSGYTGRIDAGLLLLEEELLDTRNLGYGLAHLREALLEAADRAEEEAAAALETLRNSAAAVVRLSPEALSGWDPGTGTPDPRSLARFCALGAGDVAQLETLEGFAGYFDSGWFAQDTCAWLAGLAARRDPQGALRTFGLALYHEAGESSGISVPAVDRPEVLALARALGANRSNLLQTAAVSGSRAYDQVAQDPLYGFFRVIMLNARGKKKLDTHFIEQDLGEAAVTALKQAAAGCAAWYDGRSAFYAGAIPGLLLGCLLNPWLVPKLIEYGVLAIYFSGEARRIRTLDAQVSTPSGGADRGEVAALAATFSRHRTAYARTLAGAGELLEGAGPLEAQSFLDLAGTILGSPPPAALASFVQSELASLAEEERSGMLRAIDGLLERQGVAVSTMEGEVAALAGSLLAGREETLQRYRELSAQSDLEPGRLAEAARALFLDPGLSPEDLAQLELDLARRLQPREEAGSVQALELLGSAVLGVYATALQAAAEEQLGQLAAEGEDLDRCYREWEGRAAAILAAGSLEWERSARGLAEARDRWRREIQARYLQGRELWEGKQELFEAARSRWLDQSARAVAAAAAAEAARELGLEAERTIAEVADVAVVDLGFQAGAMERAVAAAMGGQGLSRLLERARALGEAGADAPRAAVVAFLPQRRLDPGALLAVDLFVRSLSQEVRRQAEVIAAGQASQVIDRARREIEEQVLAANQEVSLAVWRSMETAGFRRISGLYVRESAIDMTLGGGLETETQRIEEYRYFRAPAFALGFDLSRRALEGLGAEAIRARTERAVSDLRSYLGLIFGEEGTDRDGLDAGFLALLDSRLQSYRGSDRYLDKGEDGAFLFKDRSGLFDLHVGYVPVMSSEDPEKVRKAGFGEMGRIYELFFRYEARLARGVAMIEMPWYSMRLWDDDADNDGKADGLIGAPSVRSLADLATSVVATATLGPGAAVLLNLVDDALFTAADVSAGVLSLGEGAVGLGRKGLIGFVTLGAGQLGSLAGGAANTATAVETIIGGTLVKGVELASTSIVTSALGAVTYSQEAGWGFDKEMFEASLVGRQALGSYLSGITGTFAQGALGAVNLADVLGLSRLHIGQVETLNGLVGGLAAGAVEYAVAGETVLNVLNARELAGLLGATYSDRWGRQSGHGLLELHIGGTGPAFEVGQAGLDAGVLRLSAGLSGLEVWRQNARIGAFARSFDEFAEGYSGSTDVAVALREQYSFGDAAGLETYERILTGVDRLHVGLAGAGGLTVAAAGGGRDIYLATLGQSRDYSRLQAGILLQHEAHRDGEAGADNRLETRRATLAHTQMALRLARDYGGEVLFSSPGLSADLIAYCLAVGSGQPGVFASYVDTAYDSSADYWRLLRNGKGGYDIAWDWRAGLYDQNDVKIMDGDERSYVNSLRHYLGLASAEEARELLAASGMVLTGTPGYLADFAETRFMSPAAIQEWTAEQLRGETFDINGEVLFRNVSLGEAVVDRLNIRSVFPGVTAAEMDYMLAESEWYFPEETRSVLGKYLDFSRVHWRTPEEQYLKSQATYGGQAYSYFGGLAGSYIFGVARDAWAEDVEDMASVLAEEGRGIQSIAEVAAGQKSLRAQRRWIQRRGGPAGLSPRQPAGLSVLILVDMANDVMAGISVNKVFKTQIVRMIVNDQSYFTVLEPCLDFRLKMYRQPVDGLGAASKYDWEVGLYSRGVLQSGLTLGDALRRVAREYGWSGRF